MNHIKTNQLSFVFGLVCLLLTLFSFSNVHAANFVDTEFNGSIILGRPTQTTITASITAPKETMVYLQWGEKSGEYAQKTDPIKCSLAEPAVLIMDNLSANKAYYYRLYFQTEERSQFCNTAEYRFQTPRNEGETYNFVIQSDSHLLNKADKDLYGQSMDNMANLNPDFMFDLGDTFLNDQTADPNSLSYDTVVQTYQQQLPYFDQVTRTAPLFLASGNHEGEIGSAFDGMINNMAAKSTLARTTYYPNPVPNDFYSGNNETEPLLGTPQNYYAFEWGDALYVTIDPYRYSDVDPYGNSSDGWDWTLGKTQYDWFKKTLENSDAKYKFVFSHHAIGNMRGGAEIAKLYEWGGYDKKGTYLFDKKRPSWGKPIQQIMADANVTIFFQGHDHLFAKEVVDGVIYQTMPKPAEKIPDTQTNFNAYTNADVLMNSGFLNVSVANDKVQVDYLRNYYVSTDSQTSNTGLVYSYTVDDKQNIEVLKSNKDNLSTYGSSSGSSSKNKGNSDSKTAVSKPAGNNKLDSTVKIGIGATPATEISAIPEGGFSFAIQADSHLDSNTNTAVYTQTLKNINSESPAFLIDLGDTFMAEKFATTQAQTEQRYIEAKKYLDTLGTLPVYLVTGNHEGENGFNAGKNVLSDWARTARLTYFPANKTAQNYSGNTETANYYTFTQDDAQFIILDPYRFTTERIGKNNNGWASTLGKVQYDWLKSTLESSQAKYKFVFIHNLIGGNDKDQRGGVEAAQYFEWGGKNLAGVDEFDKMRPGWGKPIHQLLVENNVTAVFHGHDHFYAKQELDGIVYQLVPQPGTTGNSVYDATNYGYKNGVFLPSVGHLRVVVADEKATVEYVKTETNGTITVPNTYELN